MRAFYRFIVFDGILFFFKDLDMVTLDSTVEDKDNTVYVFTNEPAFAKGYATKEEAENDSDLIMYEGEMVRLERHLAQPTLIKTLDKPELKGIKTISTVELEVTHTIIK